MAILVIFTGAGIDQDKYETLRREIGWESAHPPGAIVHAASFDESGDAHVVDVWESPEALDAFVQTHLAPTMQKHGIPQPRVEVYPLHNLDAYSGIERYLLK
jgi:hypothetical protein